MVSRVSLEPITLIISVFQIFQGLQILSDYTDCQKWTKYYTQLHYPSQSIDTPDQRATLFQHATCHIIPTRVFAFKNA